MGIKNKLENQGSILTPFKGKTPPQMRGSQPLSKLHFEYSINGNPSLSGYPRPSELDLQTPPSKYLDNKPE